MRALSLRSLLPLALLTAIAAATTPATASANAERFNEVSTHITGAQMTGIAPAWDGTLWITAPGKGSLLAMQADGQVAEWPITGLGRTASPREIAGDSQGQLWSTDPAGPVLIRSDRNGASVDIATGAASTRPIDLATGADGNVWFTTAGKTKIGQVTPSGDVSYFDVSTHPTLIARGGSGDTAAWYATEEGSLGRITLDGSTVTTATFGGTATGLAQSPDGTVWVSTAQAIHRISTDNVVTTFTGGIPAGAAISDIAVASDGYAWFSAPGARAVGRVSPEGTISMFATLNAKAGGGLGAPPERLAINAAGRPTYIGQNADALVASVVGLVNPVGIPTGSTSTADEIGTKAAVVTALVNPEAGQTSVSFEYGISARLGSNSSTVNLEAGITPQTVRIPLTDLDPTRTYYYRVIATNSAGVLQGQTLQFTAKNIPLPTTPPLPVPPKAPTGTEGGGGTAGPTAVANKLTLGGAAAKLGKKGIVKVKLACPTGAPCSATVEVTAKLGKGKRAKSVVIAKKNVTLAAGKSANVGLRINAAGQKAIRTAGKKGLATLAVLSQDQTKTRARLTLKR